MALQAGAPVVQEFGAWCSAWGLTCPGDAPANVPMPDAPWTATQWRSVFGVFGAFAQSGSDIKLTRAELQDERLTAIAAALGYGETLARARARLDAQGFAEMRLEANAGLVLAMSGPSTYTSPSGLSVEAEAEVRVGVDAEGSLHVGGVAFAGPGGDRSTIDTLTVSDTNVFRWTGPETTVEQAPIKFIAEETFGMTLGEQDLAAAPGYAELVPVVQPMLEWMTSGRREIVAQRATLARVAEGLGAVLPPSMAGGAAHILRQLVQLQSTAESRPSGLIKAVATGEIRCTYGDKARLIFDREFGIKSATRRSDTSFSLLLTGMRAQPLQGPIRPTIRMTRLDFEPTKIIVRDVPILGEYVVDMTQEQDGTLTCG